MVQKYVNSQPIGVNYNVLYNILFYRYTVKICTLSYFHPELKKLKRERKALKEKIAAAKALKEKAGKFKN